MARIRAKKKEKKEKPVFLPPCLLRGYLSETERQERIRQYTHAVYTGNERHAQNIINRFVSPRNQVQGYRRLKQHKVKELATTGWYSKGKTDPRYLGMDVK